MRNFMKTAAVLVIGLTMVGGVQAAKNGGSGGSKGGTSGGSGGSSSGSHKSGDHHESDKGSKNHDHDKGSKMEHRHEDKDRHSKMEHRHDEKYSKSVKFEHGYYYKGKHHDHWTEKRYDRRYGCKLFWCPTSTCWYYWCFPDTCYYPVSYCPYGSYEWQDEE